MPALYTARRMETGWLEAQQGFAFKAQPLTICAYEVDCTGIADCSKEDGRRALGITMIDLACAWEDLAARGVTPPSWLLASRMMSEGYADLITPSFAPGAGRADISVMFWRWSDNLPHKVVVIDDQARLPRDSGSWGPSAIS
jgi:RES domain-containing protein